MNPNVPTQVSPTVQRYWNAVSNRLRVESREMAGLIKHHGEKGRANEKSIESLLQRMLPPSVRVAPGEIIDSRGKTSAQVDTLILSNTTQPILFGQTEEILFPVESVLICIEVKSTLTKGEVRDMGPKIQKRRALTSMTDREPVFVAFAHSTGAAPATVAKWFFDLEAENRPDFFLVNDAALFGIADDSEDGYSVVMPFSPQEGEELTATFNALSIDEISFWKPTGATTGDYVRIDHGVSMLLFIRAILDVLSEMGHAEVEWLDSYLSQITSHQVLYTKDVEPSLVSSVLPSR